MVISRLRWTERDGKEIYRNEKKKALKERAKLLFFCAAVTSLILNSLLRVATQVRFYQFLVWSIVLMLMSYSLDLLIFVI